MRRAVYVRIPLDKLHVIVQHNTTYKCGTDIYTTRLIYVAGSLAFCRAAPASLRTLPMYAHRQNLSNENIWN
jgi:hypothetical protein